MARKPQSLKSSNSIEYVVGAPADARALVSLKSDLTEDGSFQFHYRGMLVSVQEDETLYMLIGTDPTKEESWKKVGDNGVELTLAEYDALPTEQKMNGTVYYITDGVPQPNVFSLLTVELEDGNGVAHTYEILGREVVNP